MRYQNMKRTLLFLPLVAILASCESAGSNPKLRKTDLKILSPMNAPAVAMYKYVNGLTTVANPASELIPMFLKDDYDVIVAPAKGGLTKIVKQNADYQMAAVVTLGNFGLVATGNDKDGVLNSGDKVLCFQQTDVPGSVFNYLYGDLGLETYFVNDVSGTATPLNTGKVTISGNEIQLDYIFSSEPVITNLNKSKQLKEWAADAFKEKSGQKQIVQAAVFVNKKTKASKVDDFLKNLEKDLKDAVTKPKTIATYMNLYGDEEEQLNKFGVSSTTVYNCMKNYNGLGLGFLRAKDHQEDINYFINDIMGSNLTLNEEVYY